MYGKKTRVHGNKKGLLNETPPIKRFAHLLEAVAANKDFIADDLLLWEIAYEAGAAAEREACAKLDKSYDTLGDPTQGWQDVFAIAIRARTWR